MLNRLQEVRCSGHNIQKSALGDPQHSSFCRKKLSESLDQNFSSVNEVFTVFKADSQEKQRFRELPSEDVL